VSRRSIKTYVEQDPQLEMGNMSNGSNSSSASESRYGSADDEREEYEAYQRRRDHHSSGSYAAATKITSSTQSTGLGRDLTAMFPGTADDRNKSGRCKLIHCQTFDADLQQ